MYEAPHARCSEFTGHIEVIGDASKLFYLDQATAVNVDGTSYGHGLFKLTSDENRRGQFKFLDCEDTFTVSCLVCSQSF